MMLTRALTLALALAAVPGFAAEEDAGDGQGWSGEGEFGLVVTTGNTETETLNAKLKGALTRDPWVYKLGVVALSSSEDGNTTAERYELSGKTEYHVSERDYWFGSARYEDDRFSGFDYQSTLTGGYGRILIDSDTSHLEAEIGAGFRRSKPAPAPDATVEPDAESDAIARGALAYWWQITETTKFENDFLVEAGADNTFLENAAGLRVAVNDRFAVKLGLAVRHNTEVPAETEKTDTVSTVNLVYSFK